MNTDAVLLAQFIAVELSAADFPHLWRVRHKAGSWWTNIITNDAWLVLQHSGDRLCISSDLPREMKRASTAERITVDAGRNPEAIARDITRRLLPNAREHFQKSREYTRKEKQERARHAEILQILQPFKHYARTESDGRRTSFSTTRAELDVHSTNVYVLKVHSPTLDETIQILQLLERTPKENDYDTE